MMKSRKTMSLKCKLILAQMAMSDNSVRSLCFFADNASMFDQPDGVSLSELADSYHLDVPTVWRHIDRLIEVGAVVRIRRGRYGLPDNLSDPQLNLLVLEYAGENSA